MGGGAQSHAQAPCGNLATLLALSCVAGDGDRGLSHTSLPPRACLVRFDQKEDQSALRTLSPDLINRPFIFTLKESAIFCLLN